jgi:hypothetical protein
MPRQCQFPVKCSDNRRCYRVAGSPGFIFSLLLIAVLAGYVGLSRADTGVGKPQALSLSATLINSDTSS